jgi:hypothetical protein
VEGDAARPRQVTQPTLVFKGAEDHVVGPASLEILRKERFGVSSRSGSSRTAIRSDDGQHRDAIIFTGSLDFVRSHSHAGKE